MPKQILLVDDSRTIQRVVELTFAHEDYAVTVASSADEGLNRARELKPDLVLADAGMAGKTGYDLCAALRASGPLATVPCLILTGNFSPYDESRGTKAGADGYVIKPFETQALIDKVADLIANKGAQPILKTEPVKSEPRPEPRKVEAPPARTLDDSVEISIDSAPTRPSIPAAAPPGLVPPRPAVPRPVANPGARTVMGMPAPMAPAKPAVTEVKPPTEMPRAPAVPVMPAARTGSGPVASPMAPPLPHAMPQMPRAPLIPNVPTPTASAPPAFEAAKTVAQRSTLLGIPAVSPVNLSPGAPVAKPTAPWAPPPPIATPVTPAVTSPPAEALVQAVAERAVSQIAARGPEYEAVAKLSREVIEQIAWEVVPELAETIIREQLDRLVAEKSK